MNSPLPSRPYHHGDLRQALLAGAERILEAEGIQALTLRAVARAVGVSHAAPANHCGDLSGLLTDLSAEGFRRLADAMSAGRAAATPGQGARAMGQAYLGFALAHPGLFTLMFRGERLDLSRPGLKEAVTSARDALRLAVAAMPGGDRLQPEDLAARAAAIWSLAHGYAVLALAGRMDATRAAAPGHPSTKDFFDVVLDSVALA